MTTWMMRLDRFDERALLALVRRRRPLIRRLFVAITHLGDALVVVGVAVALTLGAVPGLQEAGLHAAFTLALSHALVQALKRTIARPRPRLPEGMRSVIAAPDRFSFPSGHAAAALSVALPVALRLPTPAAAGVLTVGLLVGLSRSYLGVHYPGDVLAGWILAAAAALCAPLVFGAAG